MATRLLLAWICLLGLAAGTARAAAEAPRWQVTPVPLNASPTGALWSAAAPSPLTRGLSRRGDFLGLFAAELWPGKAYTLEMTVPATLRQVRVYLFDRWPFLPAARRIPLPSGPVVRVPGRRTSTRRWRIGISRRSPGYNLYFMVIYPRAPGRKRLPAPRLALYSPPLDSRHSIGRGITYLDGPRALVLQGGPPPLVELLPQIGEAGPGAVPGPGTDWLQNGDFRQGLRGWSGSRVGTRSPGQGVAMLPRGAAGASLSQALNRAVDADDRLVLEGALRLGRPRARQESRLVLTLCYRDTLGKRICGSEADLVRFSTSPAGATRARGRLVPAGRWFHFRYALRRLSQPPARLLSLSLQASGAGPVWVRDIHLHKGDSHEKRHSRP